MYHPRLRGNHYDMGRHYGELLTKSGINLSPVLAIPEQQTAFGLSCLPIYEQYLPKIMQEVRGLADGLGQRYETVACWLFALYCFENDYGCSVFAVRSGEHTYFGRNMDMFPEYKKTSESVLYMPENRNIFLAHSTAMICVEDGMNEHGLAAALTFLLPKTVKPGINGGFLIRLILEECKTAEEAAKLLQNIPISSAHNIVVADSMGEMFVAECTAEQVSVRWCEKYAAATNHFITPAMQQYNSEDENWYQTRDRLATLESVLADEHMSFEKCKELISGKRGFLCQYEKKLHFETIWSAVYDLNSLCNEICEGNPVKSAFRPDTRLAWGMNKAKRK